jgi:neurotransmitter:Na+ symporter, NSS family
MATSSRDDAGRRASTGDRAGPGVAAAGRATGRRVNRQPPGRVGTAPGAHAEHWGSRLGVILAVSGSAVGLGNFLRFPGQAAENGGGAFMIPYFCALILLGIPIGWAEWTMGRYGGQRGFHSAPGILGVMGGGRMGRHLGAIGVLIPLAVSFYYVFIEAWCLAYFWAFFTGQFDVASAGDLRAQTEASAAFYSTVTGSARDGALFDLTTSSTLVCWVLAFALNLALVYRGVSKGIEAFCSWAMPAMAVCAVIVLARVLTLGTPDAMKPDQNVINGLGYMWNPSFAALGNFQTWLAAAGQVFFTLSVGFGVIINYASYMRRHDDVVLSALTASATNEVFEVGFGGLITLTASYVFLGVSGTIAAVATGSFGLGFTTLPVVFAQMGPAGQYIGAIWFFMLFLAAITSSLSMYQPVLAFLQESLALGRKPATVLLAMVALFGSLGVLWFTRGGVFWHTLDFWVGTFLLFVMAGIQIVCFSWVFGIDRGWAAAHEGARMRIPRVFRFVMRYVAPAYLAVVFVGFCVQNLSDSVEAIALSAPAQLALLLLLVVATGLTLAVRTGERRWRAAGIDLDGLRPMPRIEASRSMVHARAGAGATPGSTR